MLLGGSIEQHQLAVRIFAQGVHLQQASGVGQSPGILVLVKVGANELVQAIQAVVEHGNYFSPPVIGPIVREYLKLASRQQSSGASLTSREREVLQLLAEGNSSKEAAFLLNLNVKTVDTHRQRIMKKLDLHNLADLTKYAIREGLTSLDLPTRK